MENRIKTLLLALALTAFCAPPSSAQGDKGRPPREDFAKVQARQIADRLALADTVAQNRFIDAYCQCQKELWALKPAPGHKPGKPCPGEAEHGKPTPPPAMTDAEAERIIKERFARAKEILNIREKYYAIYSEFLTQRQILRIYDQENHMRERFQDHRRDKGKGRRAPEPRRQ